MAENSAESRKKLLSMPFRYLSSLNRNLMDQIRIEQSIVVTVFEEIGFLVYPISETVSQQECEKAFWLPKSATAPCNLTEDSVTCIGGMSFV